MAQNGPTGHTGKLDSEDKDELLLRINKGLDELVSEYFPQAARSHHEKDCPVCEQGNYHLCTKGCQD